jgi:hypothetical protein
LFFECLGTGGGKSAFVSFAKYSELAESEETIQSKKQNLND